MMRRHADSSSVFARDVDSQRSTSCANSATDSRRRTRFQATSWLAALAASAAWPAVTPAQTEDSDRCPFPAMAVPPGMIHGGNHAPPGYSDRYDRVVYDIGIPSGDFRSSGTNVYDDVTFASFAKIEGAISINGFAIGFSVPANATVLDDHLYTKISFFPNHDNTVPPTVAPFSGTPVVVNLDWGGNWSAAAGFIAYYQNLLTFTGPGLPAVLDETNVFSSISDYTCGVYEELFLDSAMTRYADTWQIARRGGAAIVPSVGSTDIYGWFSGTTNNSSYNIVNGNRSGTPTSVRASYLALQGTGYVIVNGGPSNFGCIADGSTTRSGNLAADTVAWYSVCVNNDATDTNLRYLDSIVSSSSSLMQVWFDSNGNRLEYAFDRGTGTGGDSVCSFGIGRRARPAGAQTDLDGRHYLSNAVPGLSATTGPGSRYYFAVMPSGSSFGNAGWAVSPSGPGGSYTITLNTNNNSGALGPSVPPTPTNDLSATPLASPGLTIPPSPIDAHGVRWVKFSTCRRTSNDYTLTINLSVLGSSNASTSHHLFNSDGVIVASASDPGPFTVAAPLVFDASNPLPAGTYYLAQTYMGVNLAPAHDRWHLRSTSSTSGFTFSGSLVVTGSPCPPICHGVCVADFDDGTFTGTPDGGVTIDDLLYYLHIFEQGAPCADIDDGTATGTPDGGVTIDDLLYYVLRFEAGC